jgi:serine/threonine-protein kinase
LIELERLAFLPRGEVLQPIEPVSFGTEEPLLVDMYEVTRDDWSRYQTAARPDVDPLFARHAARWQAGSGDWPVSYVTQGEARAFADWRGMRLLTLGEWLFCAMGTNARDYPWGTTPQESVANTLELRLERPAPVGTFESGRTPQWCYDLVGNVSEWIADPVPVDLAPGDGRMAAMGGSYLTRRRALYRETGAYFAELLHPKTRAVDVGLRCAAPAEAFLWEHAPEWGEGPEVEARLVAIGRRWGRQASPLLDGLATRAGAPPGLRALAEGARQ